MTPEGRRRLLAAAQELDLLIIEDEAYRNLVFDGSPPLTLWAEQGYGENVVVRLGSFSKTVGPGLRIGWLIGPAELRQGIIDCGFHSSGGGPAHLSALALYPFCASGQYDAHLRWLRCQYRDRAAALRAGLLESFDEASVPPATGGFFSWLQMSRPVSRDQLVTACARNLVAVKDGAPFAAGFEGERSVKHLRLSWSAYPPETIKDGAIRVGRALGEVGVAPYCAEHSSSCDQR
jgi:DNA-binding transcriptional MocR family regulator